MKLILGTRKSLLAWTQSHWVVKEIQKYHPEIQIQLQGIETQGDRIVDRPLHQMVGKEFFVTELDTALRNKQVDFTVHSLKDVSLERPPEFACAAIPQRENPRDIVFFSPHLLTRLRSGNLIQIGTSSPRRKEMLTPFLRQALPQVGDFRLECVDIRGNITTRLKRIHESLNSSQYLDGVVVALAGVIRLWRDPVAQVEFRKWIEKIRFMVFPLRECPTTPGQGALMVECRREDERVHTLLHCIHHLETAQSITQERHLLADWGGGCHHRLGATVMDAGPDLGSLFWIRGIKPDQTQVQEVRWSAPSILSLQHSQPVIWNGHEWKMKFHPIDPQFWQTQLESGLLNSAKHFGEEEWTQLPVLFIAHSRAFQSFPSPIKAQALWKGVQAARIWTTGTASWFQLAKQGLWVEGCSEGFGFDWLQSLRAEPVLQLPQASEWIILTHQDAIQEWRLKDIRAFATYVLSIDKAEQLQKALAAATVLFWSSGFQFQMLKDWIRPKGLKGMKGQIRHACGPGKTAQKLKAEGMQPDIFPSVSEWKNWIQDSMKN